MKEIKENRISSSQVSNLLTGTAIGVVLIVLVILIANLLTGVK